MVSISSDADVFLIPASSAEDSSLIDTTLVDPGLEESDIGVGEVAELEADLSRTDSILSDLQRQRDELEERRESSGSPEREEVESELAEIHERIAETETIRSVQEDDLTEQRRRLEDARDEFDELCALGSGNGDPAVQCWPVDEELGNQYSFSSGDLLLFYTGNHLYEYAATLDETAEYGTLGDVIIGDRGRDRSRSLFLVLSGVYPVQIDSSVIAELADRDLESVQQVYPLDGDEREELIQRFGGLSDFLRDAQGGLNVLPQNPTPEGSGGWTIGGEEADTATESESTAESGAPVEPGGSATVSDSSTSPSTTEFPEGGPDERGRPADWETLAGTLERHKLVALVGPRGTGKRRSVEELVSRWIDEESRVPPEERVLHTRFTSATEYSEFVLGQFGNAVEGEGNLVTGPFGQFVDLAAADTTQFIPQSGEDPPRYIAIIEDLHNADLPRVFGDLWRVLPPHNRGEENPVRLSGAAAKLWIPRELYVVGIIDTNQAPPQNQLDIAESPFVVRRTTPDYQRLRDTFGYGGDDDSLSGDARDDDLGALSILALERLNTLIRDSELLDDRHVFGQGYLGPTTGEFEPRTESELYEAWQYDILPTLSGYHEEGLSAVTERLLPPIEGEESRITLGKVHSDPDLTRRIVVSLAVEHPEY